jgi:hypothetical protein
MSPEYSPVDPAEEFSFLSRSRLSDHFLRRERYLAIAAAASSFVMLSSSSFVGFGGGGSLSGVLLMDDTGFGGMFASRMLDTVSKNAADEKKSSSWHMSSVSNCADSLSLGAIALASSSTAFSFSFATAAALFTPKYVRMKSSPMSSSDSWKLDFSSCTDFKNGSPRINLGGVGTNALPPRLPMDALVAKIWEA